MSAARTLHAQLHLFDRQVVRAEDGRMVCKVDDLETALDEQGRPYVTAILAGPLALGPRIGGVLGRLVVAVTELFRPEEDPAPQRIPMELVSGIGSAVEVGGDVGDAALEEWVREYVIAPIPGSGDTGGRRAARRAHAGQDNGRARMSELIGLPVIDSEGEQVGQVVDVQLTQDGPMLAQVQHAFRVAGLVVGPRHSGRLFGYERGPGGAAPGLVKSVIRRLHRGSRYVRWSQVERMAASEEVRLAVPRAELARLEELYERDPG
ncbi:PRC-barrel domain-containing protein [Sphaerisporangium fuscum]|uniref:PRC-barrel domain-containing protein n=1 Tax=Sphaerisporangium fuscum TaxID=2835868 RepID=UPI001BDD3C6F|nr:PRC-barrel domain-containing protein [Sphaerisporangium fuscum]